MTHSNVSLRTQEALSLLRNRQDRRTLLWAFGLFPLPLALAARWPTAAPWLLPLSVYVGFSAGVLSHNHNHRGVFKHARLNHIYSHWLTFFYGFPLWAWIPTHNQNHHKYLNGPGDETSTAKSSVPDGLWAAISFPTRSSAWQIPALSRYFKAQRAKGALLSVLTPVLILPLGALALSLMLLRAHPPQTAALILAVGWLVPILTASWSMMFLNYLQHIGCDPKSPTRHSRDFVGRWENWLVFNAGLHTVHHEHPGAHWSEYPRLHAARAAALDPALMEQNVPTFLWRRYLSPRCLGGQSHHALN